MAINIEETVAMVRALEARIADEEKIFKDKMKPFEELAEELRNRLMDFLQVHGMRATGQLKTGSAYIADKTSWKVVDQAEFRRHVIGTESWDMIIWGVNRTAAAEFEKTEDALPPGVSKTTIKELRVLAPERKQTRGKLSVVPSEGASLEELDIPVGFE
jgi:hypothetical protein